MILIYVYTGDMILIGDNYSDLICDFTIIDNLKKLKFWKMYLRNFSH